MLEILYAAYKSKIHCVAKYGIGASMGGWKKNKGKNEMTKKWVTLWYFKENCESMTAVVIWRREHRFNWDDFQLKIKMPSLETLYYQVYHLLSSKRLGHCFLATVFTGREGNADEGAVSITKTSFMTSRWLWCWWWWWLWWWWWRGVSRVWSEQSLSVLVIRTCALLTYRGRTGQRSILTDQWLWNLMFSSCDNRFGVKSFHELATTQPDTIITVIMDLCLNVYKPLAQRQKCILTTILYEENLICNIYY